MMNRYIFKAIVSVLYLLNSSIACADDYYAQHETGWYWFDDPAPERPVPDKIQLNQMPHQADQTATEQVKKARLTIKQALDEAIVDPTLDNVSHYIAIQNQMSERANQFANRWAEVILNHPELNYAIHYPTNNIALQVYHEHESTEKITALNEFKKHSGLFFFYKSICPYCQRFAPILKHFADQYHIAVIPITMDGIALPEFPDSKKDSGQSVAFHVAMEPSLYAVNPVTQKAYPVAFGLITETELFNNIYNIETHYQAGLS